MRKRVCEEEGEEERVRRRVCEERGRERERV